ncbi:hypothetical protein D3Y57_03835 (plasmid) [Sphingomonas paeninsulae]|uniref:Uncharacterized protein n=1 Tax=Sphingomonas paeninsulae TaxID=2319844 RepID=A0A494T6Y9_SPHPE|nr:AMP-binding protein [Sphingomonas paeninsulae]AYJ85169.1 hypothetical protein D3Y57_03835 [Sphingomonas paeninsulae]
MSLNASSNSGRQTLLAALNGSASIHAAAERAGALMPNGLLVISRATGIEEITLGSVMNRAPYVAAGMAAFGIRPGDVVAVQLPQGAELALCFAAVARLGAILLTITPSYGPDELGFVLRQSGARLLITPEHLRHSESRARVAAAGALPDLLAHIVVEAIGEFGWEALERSDLPIPSPAIIDREDDTLLVYTSGTTAAPKGVRHSHRSILNEIASIQISLGSRAHGAVVAPWPSGHIAGALVTYRFLLLGMTMLSLEHWDAERAVRLIESHRAVQGTGTPFHLTGLLDAAEATGCDISSLQDFQVGAAPVPSRLVERCSEKHIRTYRSYGSTEHPTSTYGSPLDPLEKRLTTEGRIVAGAELRTANDAGVLLDDGAEGEIVTRGPDRFSGYWDAGLDAEAFLPDGWYRSGDIGFVDADGYLVLTDRKKDIIIRGGENVSSKDVENHLSFHPSIAEVAVIAAPDERMGEAVAAVVVLRSGTTLDLPDIAAWFASRSVPRFKTPSILVIASELPRNSTGKVLKHALRDALRCAGTP